MMIRNFLITAVILFVSVCTGFSQGVNEIKINEILVKNETNYEDDYGNREAWIELFNASHSSVNIGGCYLTVKQGNSDMTYRIPSSDKRTVIPPLGYVVFFCEGTQTKGTFHTNFTLDQTGYLAFLDAGGGVIDEVTYDVDSQIADVSLGRIKGDDDSYSFRALDRTTPMSINETAVEVPQFELFRRRDPSGIVLTITAMSVVFSSLLVLFLFFKILGKNMVRIATRKERMSRGEDVAEIKASPVSETSYSGEEIAAIALAMKMYQEDLHDKESTVLTINRVARAYSPWSSKIYGLRQIPTKK